MAYGKGKKSKKGDLNKDGKMSGYEKISLTNSENFRTALSLYQAKSKAFET